MLLRQVLFLVERYFLEIHQDSLLLLPLLGQDVLVLRKSHLWTQRSIYLFVLHLWTVRVEALGSGLEGH